MGDPLLDAAIAHWAARFTANGVDPSDVADLAAGIESWDQWCGEWSAIGARHEALGRAARAEGRRLSAGQHLAQAALGYHFAKFLFFHDPEQARVAHAAAVRCLDDALADLDPPGERHVVDFASSHLVGVLRRPPGPPRPVVLLVPGLDSAKEELGQVERSFLERGLATFSLDGPGQGEAEYDLAIRGDWEIPGGAVIDYLERCEGVDATRVGVWGVSLGGYYAPRIASGDERVSACVALSGPYRLADSWEGLPELTRDAFRVRSHSSSPRQARDRAAELDLTGRAAAISCPLLVVFGDRDRLFPLSGAARLAAEASGPTELLVVPGAGHGCANLTYCHRPRAADWMAAQLTA